MNLLKIVRTDLNNEQNPKNTYSKNSIHLQPSVHELGIGWGGGLNLAEARISIAKY